MNDEFSYIPGPFYVVRRVFHIPNNAAQVWCISMHVKHCTQSDNKNGHDTDIWVLSEEGNYLFMSKGNNSTAGDPQKLIGTKHQFTIHVLHHKRTQYKNNRF